MIPNAHNKTGRAPAPPHEILAQVLTWSRQRDYAGYSKHDALNSPFLNAMTLGTKSLRLVAIQGVMRFPINLRPLFAVPRLRNPKGVGLFAQAYLDLAADLKNSELDAGGLTRDECLSEAKRLLAWLIHTASPWAPASDTLKAQFPKPDQTPTCKKSSDDDVSLHGLGWGYHYPWQDVGFFQPRHFPNRVVSSWIGFAFIRAYEVTREPCYLNAAGEIAEFMLNNPRRIVDDSEQLCLSYVPTQDIEWAVMDVSALVSALVVKVLHHGGHIGDTRVDPAEQAQQLMRFVVDKQTNYGAWYYTWPSTGSHITHDNYHSGIILDCLADFMTYSGSHEYVEQYRAGLEFYKKRLFLDNGAPRWMDNRTYPHDIHGSAAGILCFERAANYFETHDATPASVALWREMASKVRRWTLENLYSRDGYFYYQKTPLRTKRFNLMRWSNAWMCHALAKSL